MSSESIIGIIGIKARQREKTAIEAGCIKNMAIYDINAAMRNFAFLVSKYF
jgi:hypothetical protein